MNCMHNRVCKVIDKGPWCSSFIIHSQFPQADANLNGGHDELWVALQRPEKGKVDAGHDGRPRYLVCSRLDEHGGSALGVVGVYMLVQELVPRMANGAVDGEAI